MKQENEKATIQDNGSTKASTLTANLKHTSVGVDSISAKNGITLIALVVTIILMLILAGVVLSLTIGEKGMFARAKQVGTMYEEAQAREKLELVLLDLQADKVTDKTYNQTGYINAKITQKGMSVNGNIVMVDGWQFEIDRSVPQIGRNLGKGEVITIAQPYVGTSSFTISIPSVPNEADVESYTYIVDNVEETSNDQKEYTKEELEPESHHTAYVIIKYKNGTALTSNTLNIQLQPRTYLYDNGNEYEEITNGWLGQSIYGYGTSYGQYEKAAEYLYVKNTSTNDWGNSNYYPSWVISSPINLSQYKKIVAEGDFYAPSNTTIRISISTVRSPLKNGTYYTVAGTYGQKKEKIELDLTKANVDLNNLYYIAITCQNSNYNDHTEATIRRVWLEK